MLFTLGCNEPTTPQLIDEILNCTNLDDRSELQQKLAQRYDSHGIDILLPLAKSNSIAEESLNYLMKNYGESFSLSTADSTKCKVLISKIVEFNSADNEFGRFKINLLLTAMVNNNFYGSFWTNLLVPYCVDGFELTYTKWKETKNDNLLNILNEFGACGNDFLLNLLGRDKDAIEVLARLGHKVVAQLKSQMNSEDRNIRFSAADALIRMKSYAPDAVADLSEALGENNLNFVADNYPFYIRLGAAGSEGILIKALKRAFTERMCLDYLNCGNYSIESDARDVANSRGYNVTSGIGTYDGPKWGSGN